MSERPIFVPGAHRRYVDEIMLDFDWSPGFAPVQKQKNIRKLHAAAKEAGYFPILEVSTKSENPLGVQLSAFNLRLNLFDRLVPLESVFQGSKVFEEGGPFEDLYLVSPREARSDERVRNSGSLIGFSIADSHFPTRPRTCFYDWLYISALYPRRDELGALDDFAGFSDIEFNPERSINCQARSCALFVALRRRGLLDSAALSFDAFFDISKDMAFHSQFHGSQRVPLA
jgi:hypothetical protein